MTVTLYGKNGACSMAVHVLLNEIGKPFDYINAFDDKNAASDTLKKLNPLGQIPVLVDGDLVLTEGAAILTYLAEKNQSKLLPAAGAARAKAQQWLGFANSTMHPAYGRAFFVGYSGLEDGPAKEKLLKAASDRINTLWARVEQELAKHRYVAGEEMTVADILLTVIANWTPRIPGAASFGPNVTRLLKEVSSRPAYQKTLSAEQVEYKAAA